TSYRPLGSKDSQNFAGRNGSPAGGGSGWAGWVIQEKASRERQQPEGAHLRSLTLPARLQGSVSQENGSCLPRLALADQRAWPGLPSMWPWNWVCPVAVGVRGGVGPRTVPSPSAIR